MVNIKQLLLPLLIIVLIDSVTYASALWENDFACQRPGNVPKLEARYMSSNRDRFFIDAERYSILLDLKNNKKNAVHSLSVNDSIIYNEGHFELIDQAGTVWSSLHTSSPSRINLYRRGPYYNEIHWLDVSFCNGDDVTAPIRGEIVFYSYAETCRIGVVLHATEEIQIQTLSFVLQKNHDTTIARQSDLHERHLVTHQNNGSKIAWFATTNPYAKYTQIDDKTFAIQWHDENAPYALIPKQPKQFDVGMISLAEGEKELEAALNPLQGDRLILKEGLELRFDARRGDYVVSSHNPGGFNYHYYENQNDYRMAHIQFLNNHIKRKIYVRHEIGSGSKGQVECGVVLNNQKELLPIRVQISKNFAGEKEEKFYNPGDDAFSEIYFPLLLEPDENVELYSLQLYQNWGNHPLKQFSSLGAWMDYFHMSTGVTETTCYVPFRFYTGISIADLRGMSGRMWESQPQHDNVGGHIFMEYTAADRPNEKQTIVYEGTTYHSTGPNWADITFNYHSSDERLKIELETFEYAQLDELRNFIRLKCAVLEDIPINDWATDFRIMQIDTHTQHLRYQNVTYIDEEDRIVTKPIQFDGLWTLKGTPMTAQSPTVVLWNSPKGNNAFIVEKVKGTIGGKPLQSLAVSCEGRENDESNLVLAPYTNAKGLQKGDAFEIDLFIMPFGKKGDDYTAAMTERRRYGLNPVRINQVQGGKIRSHFPPKIQILDEHLEFSIQGGYAVIGVCIEGLNQYDGWILQKETSTGWKSIPSQSGRNLGIKGEGQQRYVCDDGRFGVVFRIKLDGEAANYRLARE